MDAARKTAYATSSGKAHEDSEDHGLDRSLGGLEFENDHVEDARETDNSEEEAERRAEKSRSEYTLSRRSSPGVEDGEDGK